MDDKISLRRDAKSAAADLARHERKCTICNHPEREAIEEDFIHWRPRGAIVTEFKISSGSVISRHAHAVGLYERRDANLRFALGYIIERADCIHPSADAIVRAARAYACLSPVVRWVEPPTTHVVVPGVPPNPAFARSSNLPQIRAGEEGGMDTDGGMEDAQEPGSLSAIPDTPNAQSLNSNRVTLRLEGDSTR